jgi:hypothetical protein
MNDATGYARRYHWLRTSNFTEAPPESIAGTKTDKTLNLVSGESKEARENSVGFIQDNPARLRKYFTGQTTLFEEDVHRLPERHEILSCDLTKKDWEVLDRAYELQPKDYKELVYMQGMGKKKLRALALVSRLVYGNKLDWKDPVKYSFAHGGKDGIPYPVDRRSYDHTISFLRETIEASKLDSKKKTGALKRLARLE